MKYVFLTLYSEIRCTLFEACQSSKHDDGMILAKAVTTVKRQMLVVDEIFKDDLSREVQRVLVPIPFMVAHAIHYLYNSNNQ